MFPPAHRPARLRHRPGDARRLQPPLPAVPRSQRARPRRASRPPTGTASSVRSASASSSTTCASNEAAERLQREFDAAHLPMDVWQQVKLHYIGLLTNHHQPELAETFFNSVTTKILHRSYFHNDFIFVRPAVSTEYIENDEPAAAADLPRLLPDARDAARHAAAHRRQLPACSASSRTSAATSTTCSAPWSAELGDVAPARQLPDPGAVVAVLPQQGRLRGRQDHQRLHRDRRSRCRSCTASAAGW